MGSQYGLTIVDFDGQKGSFAINTVPLTAGNFAAQSALMDTLRAETAGIIDGDIQSQHINISTDYLPVNAKAADPDAMRGNKWVVSCYDNLQFLTGAIPNPTYFKPFHYDVPTADLGKRVNGSDIVFVAGGVSIDTDVDDFVAAFEAIAKSPNGGGLQVTQVASTTRAGG